MLKSINWKRILMAFCWLISLSGLVALMGFINIKKAEQKCTDIKIIIPGTQYFVERQEIDAILLKGNGQLIGRNLAGIDIQQLEYKLMKNPFVENARVYTDMNGVLNVKITQREPVLRVINMLNQNFYIDKKGVKIPVSDNFTANVLAANGFIMESYGGKIDTLKTRIGRDLYTAATFISNDSLWDAQIEQLFVNANNEIIMIPRVGNHQIILGNAKDLPLKFKNLMIFYKKAMPTVGWNAYKTINIKYANQVVCERADSLDVKKIASKSRVDSLQKAVKDTAEQINQIQDTIKITL